MNSILNIKNTTLEKHVSTLLALSRNRHVITGHIEDTAKEIARMTAQNLQVSRVGIWIFSYEHNCLEPLTIYSLKDNAFEVASPLQASAFPTYLEGLKKEKIIAVTDVETDAHTQEL